MFSKIELRINTRKRNTEILKKKRRTLIESKSKFVVFIFLLAVSITSLSQSIPLTLMAKDSRTGMQINPKFEAKSMKVDLDLRVSKVQNYMVVKVQRGDKIIVKAQLDGYYPDEKIYEIDEDFDDDGRNIIFELDPQPAANLTLNVVDKVNGKKLDAFIELTSEGNLVKKINTKETLDITNILLTLPGSFQIIVTSDGYEPITFEQEIVVSDPPEKFEKTIELQRKKNVISLEIVDANSGSALKGVKLRVTESNGDVLKNNRTKTDKTEINLKNATEIVIEAEAIGYQDFKKSYTIDGDKLIIELVKEPTILIEVLDGFNKERISANVVITSPSGTNTTIKTSENESFVFVPTEKGNYQYTATKEGFQAKTSSINISQLKNYENELSIKLNSIYEDFLILVFDEEKNVIPAVDVRVFDKNEKELPIEFEKSTGEWIVKLVKTEQYSYSASVKGYQVKKGELDLSKGKLIPVILSKDLREVKIITLDKYTNQPVNSSISFKSSKVSKDPTSEHLLTIEPDQVIKPVFKAEGYYHYEADPISNDTEATVYMIAENYPIKLKVTDIEGNNIIPDYISIINKETSSPENIREDNTVLLNAESNYYIDIKKEGYSDHSSPFLAAELITENKSQKIVKLSLKEFISQNFKVVNADNAELVPNLVAKATSKLGDELQVTNDENIWSVKAKNGEAFTLTVASEGYESSSKEFTTFTNETEIIKLTKVETTEQVFEAYDEFLQRLVPAKFTLMDEEKTTDLPLFDQGVHAKANLIAGNEYTIRVSAADYQDKEETFFTKETPAAPLRIVFKRRTYPVKFVLKTNGEKLFKSPSLKITLNKKALNTPYIFGKKTFAADLQADETYDLVLNVEGFRPISEKVSVADLVETNLVKEYLLEEIIEEKPVEIKEVVVKKKPVEPETVEAVPSEEEPVATIPKKSVKVADIYAKNKENLDKIPETEGEMLSVLSSKEAVGKRYILTKVYFEQSSPKMRPESDEQLNSILQVLKSNSKLRIELVGHTDNVGDSRQNTYLSKFRAKVVGNYLYNQGIDDSRISVKGMGGEFPVVNNDNEENKAKNRRVELIVIEN